jgi:hypothetical protein
MLEKVYGHDEAESILKLWDKSVHSERSEIIAFRPDLSYVPAAK